MRIDQVLLAVAPKSNAKFIQASVECDAAAIMFKWELTDAKSQAQLIGQMALESGGFRTFEENLNYSAQRLTQVWPKRYPSIAAAQPYAHNPKALAINCYGSRGGNIPGTNDGWDYRGSAALQHTFRPEFERVERRTGLKVVASPDKLRDPSNAKAMWEAACSFIVDRGALAAAKAGQTETVTRKINGGVNGLSDRITYVTRAAKIIGNLPISSTQAAAQSPGTPVIVIDDKTKTEIAEDENKKKTGAVIGATTGTVGAGPVSTGGKVPETHSHWFITAGIVIAVAIVGVFVVRYFTKRADAAQSAVEVQQLAGTMIRAEGEGR